MVGSPWSPGDSKESSPTPQFKSINSSVFSFLYSPSLTSIHDYWKSTRQTFVGNVMSLLLNKMSRLVMDKAMVPHSSTIAWKIPWTEEPGRLQSMGSRRVGHDWVTSLSLFTFMHWRKKWQPTPVFAWRIPGTGEPGGLPSMGSHRVEHDWSDLAAAAAACVLFPPNFSKS